MSGTFLMLAHGYKDQPLEGWYVSEKLDGQRAYWDGGITRGLAKSEVGWANHGKDERYVDPPICTGLWSRYGNIIHAPDWWLDTLPKCPLDGELYTCQSTRQELRSCISRLDGSGPWNRVHYYVFDIPPYERVLEPRYINIPNQSTFIKPDHLSWTLNLVTICNIYRPGTDLTFKDVVELLPSVVEYGVAIPHEQHLVTDISVVYELLAKAEEGVIVRDPLSRWRPERSHSMLKIKHVEDAEGTVIGYRAGKGKLLGMLGTLILDIGGKELEISGFTDYERTLTGKAGLWAADNPGEIISNDLEPSTLFPLDSVVTYKYRGLSKDGIPQEARYWRMRNES